MNRFLFSLRITAITDIIQLLIIVCEQEVWFVTKIQRILGPLDSPVFQLSELLGFFNCLLDFMFEGFLVFFLSLYLEVERSSFSSSGGSCFTSSFTSILGSIL